VPTTGDAFRRVVEAASGERRQGISRERAAHLNVGPSLAGGGLYLAGRNAVVRFS
jgi:hypothetical protein